MAMPSGLRIPFRYDQKWVAPSVLTALRDGAIEQIEGRRAALIFVDQGDPSRVPVFVPCRTATIVNPLLLGQTVSLQLELGTPALAQDIDAFQSEIRASAIQPLPHWTSDGISGNYWLEAAKSLSVEETNGLATWERVVQQLASYPDFEDEAFFYAVEALVDVASEEVVSATKNRYLLRANREYSLRLYHYHPDKGDPGTILGLDTTQHSLTFTSNPEVALDSRYDLKQVRFHTGVPVTRLRELITIRRKLTNEEGWESEFEIPIHVRGTVWRKVGIAALIGSFLAASQIVQAYSNPNLSNESRVVITVVSLLTGFLAGIAAAFGLRRSV